MSAPPLPSVGIPGRPGSERHSKNKGFFSLKEEPRRDADSKRPCIKASWTKHFLLQIHWSSTSTTWAALQDCTPGPGEPRQKGAGRNLPASPLSRAERAATSVGGLWEARQGRPMQLFCRECISSLMSLKLGLDWHYNKWCTTLDKTAAVSSSLPSKLQNLPLLNESANTNVALFRNDFKEEGIYSPSHFPAGTQQYSIIFLSLCYRAYCLCDLCFLCHIALSHGFSSSLFSK